MRDSTGNVAPLRVTAYALDGDSLSPQPEPAFVVLDTGAHLAGALLVGDSIGKTVRVVGTVGSLQTQFASVKVTALPDTLVPADSLVFHKSFPTLSTTDPVSAELGVLVRHLLPTPTGVEAVIVRYSIDRAPAGRDGQGPLIVLVNGNVTSSRDTTDATGKAARAARLRLIALNTIGPDTVEISATASYAGRVLGLVQFLVIFTQTSP
jgi:hypothetical protein